jgi:DNA-binding transcriptional ArsR family regulator
MNLGERTKVFKALGNPARLAMVDALGVGELCVCQLVEVAGLKWATVSRHLAVLKEAGVVEDEKRGKNVYYRLRLTCVAEMNRCLDGNACVCGGKRKGEGSHEKKRRN